VTPRAPSAVCLLFIALDINKEKDNANGILSFITQGLALSVASALRGLPRAGYRLLVSLGSWTRRH